MSAIQILRFGTLPYGQALALQLQLRQQVYETGSPGYLLLLEHSPVITLGKRGKEKDIVNTKKLGELGAELFKVDRGGEATFHGPGQLVVYPILNLERTKLGVVDLVRGLADSLGQAVFETANIEIEYDNSNPGLWTKEAPARKMASVGMRVSKKVSTHGAAINLNLNLIPFSYFVACGMPNTPMTRLRDYVDHEIDINAFETTFLKYFQLLFDIPFEKGSRFLPGPGDWILPDRSF